MSVVGRVKLLLTVAWTLVSTCESMSRYSPSRVRQSAEQEESAITRSACSLTRSTRTTCSGAGAGAASVGVVAFLNSRSNSLTLLSAAASVSTVPVPLRVLDTRLRTIAGCATGLG